MNTIFRLFYILLAFKFLISVLFFDWLESPLLSLFYLSLYVLSLMFSKYIVLKGDPAEMAKAELEWLESDAQKVLDYKTIILIFILLGPINFIAIPLYWLLKWAANTVQKPSE